MPFYAGENKLSQKQFDDSIEISSEQYGQALAHLASGGLIKIHNGQMILTQQPEQLPEHEPPQWIDGEWVHEPKPEPEPEPPQPDPAAAAKHALSPGTEAFQVFTWMWELSAANTQGNRARSDINGNLALTFLWQGDPAMASAGLDAAFADLWDAADPPDGYQQIVEDWRDEFHLRAPNAND